MTCLIHFQKRKVVLHLERTFLNPIDFIRLERLGGEGFMTSEIDCVGNVVDSKPVADVATQVSEKHLRESKPSSAYSASPAHNNTLIPDEITSLSSSIYDREPDDNQHKNLESTDTSTVARFVKSSGNFS